MVDLTEQEVAALRVGMARMGEVMEEIGWQTRLADLSAEQAFTLVEAAVGGFQEALLAATASGEVPF